MHDLNNQIPVYIDEINVEKGILLLDFPPTPKESETSFKSAFLTAIGREADRTDATMLEIRGVYFNDTPPRTGSYYYLPDDFLSKNFWTEVNEDEEEFHFLAFRAELKGEVIFSLGNAIKRTEYIFLGEDTQVDDLEKTLSRFNDMSFAPNKIQLVAHDVGQGNCNQVFFGCCSFVMYDFGSREKTKLDKALTNFGSNLLMDIRDCQLNRILCKDHGDNEISLRIFVLSHWDIDHYNAINQMEQSMIDLFDLFIIPKEVPTDTAKRAFDRLPPNKTIKIEMRRRVRRGAVRLQPIYRNQIFRLYRGSKSSNRNKSGLVLSIKAPNSNAILPADHDYFQIHDIVHPYHRENELYFIIPHHGGHAGRVSLLNKWSNLQEVVYSVGINQWGHPFGYVTGTVNSIARINVRHDTRTDSEYKKTMT